MLRKFFKALNILSLIALFFSCINVYIEPTQVWQLSFIGFGFPVILIVNFLFLLLWLAKRDFFVLLPLLGIILTWRFVEDTFPLNFKEPNVEKGIKLMSWNVKSFDLYNWSKNKETRNRMMELIRHENPDLLCMQEFYSNNQFFQNIEFLRDSLGYKYYHFPPGIEIDKISNAPNQGSFWGNKSTHHQWGVATFSKYPIVYKGRIEFNNSLANDCIYTDFRIDGKQIRVYNVHFQSIYLGYEDYAVIDSLEGRQRASWKSVRNILRKIRKAFAKRSWQANALASRIRNNDNVQILCGDFNDTPVSYTYHKAGGELNDAFVEKGWGFGTTFANRFSIFRIDYTLLDPRLKINSCKTIRKELSDHYPVITTFSI